MPSRQEVTDLIQRYAAFRALDGMTPQERGQRFNPLIADVLTAHGVPARVSVRRPYGEVDVVFTVSGAQYILEAKWEQNKTSHNEIHALRGKTQARLAGTRSVFLSMSGYTPDALRATTNQVNILLLDRDHFEAMLSGMVPPAELFELTVEHASYYGQAYTPLADLLTPHDTTSTMELIDVDGAREGVAANSLPTVRVDSVLTVTRSGQLGIAAIPGQPDTILLTVDGGVFKIDLAVRAIAPVANLTFCHRNAVAHTDGSVYVARRDGVGRIADGELRVVAGGLVANSTLVSDLDGEIWAVTGPVPGDSATRLTKIGNQLGQEARSVIDVPSPAEAYSAVWLTRSEIVLPSSLGLRVYQPQFGITATIPMSTPGTTLVRKDDDTAIVFDSTNLTEVNIRNGAQTALAGLCLRPSVAEIARTDNGDVFAASYDFSPEPYSFTVVRLCRTA